MYKEQSFIATAASARSNKKLAKYRLKLPQLSDDELMHFMQKNELILVWDCPNTYYRVIFSNFL